MGGSGAFVGGHGNWDGAGDGGTVQVSALRTGETHINGGIPSGTPDLISGGVFVISGAGSDTVHTHVNGPDLSGIAIHADDGRDIVTNAD